MEFFQKFIDMEPMKYYDSSDLNYVKAQQMIHNLKGEYIAMEKRDGEWARAIIMEDGVLIQSRSVSKITGTYGDKTELVPHIVSELKSNYPAGTILLGELAFEDIRTTSRDVGSILRCKVDKALDRQKETKLHFFVFDCLAYAYEDFSSKAFSHRFQSKHITPSSLLQMRFPMAEYIHVVENTESDFMEFAEKLWALGAEGIVIVRKEAKYKPGSRTAWDTLKLKKQIGEIDMKVIDVIEPKKNYEGTELESWQYFVDDIPVTKPFYHGWKNGVVVEYQGRIIKVSSGLTDEEREWLATSGAQDAISSGSLYAAITGMEFTEDSLRHPVFLTFKNK
jgi:ATP-dependent DNA ligase